MEINIYSIKVSANGFPKIELPIICATWEITIDITSTELLEI